GIRAAIGASRTGSRRPACERRRRRVLSWPRRLRQLRERAQLDSFPDQRGTHGRVAQRFDFALALPGVYCVQIGVETGVAAELGRALGKLLDDSDQGFDSDQIR